MAALKPDGVVWPPAATARDDGACVQVGWHTSSYSTGEGACIQVAPGPDRVLVRDSKDPDGPALALPTPAWQAFLLALTR